jgi:arylformamidase
MNIVDLTLPIHEGMLTFPSKNHPSVEISVLGRIEETGRATRKISLGTHTGTHVDAPAHFLKNGLSIDRLDLSALIGKAHMIDLSALPPKTAIQKSHLTEAGSLEGVERLVIRTGWSAQWNTGRYYSDYPYLSQAACEFIVSHHVKLLALDVPSPDNPMDCHGSNNDSPNHKFLFGNGVVLAEYLANLDKISVADFFIAALPLPVRDGDAAPARIIAYWD